MMMMILLNKLEILERKRRGNRCRPLAFLALVYILFISLQISRKFGRFLKMFTDSSSEVIGFESTPENERHVSDMGCQTSDLKTSSQETQTTSSQSSACQAIPDVLKAMEGQSYDADKLLKFLNRVVPHLEEELKSCDFSGDLNFNLEFGNAASQEKKTSEQLSKQIVLTPDFCKGKVVSCLSWNASNIMLAVASSELSHKGWCCHESVVGLYNTGRPQFEKNPSQLLKVSGCVRCISFHNHIPSLLAAGLYSGEVVVWDLKHDEEVLVNKTKGPGEEAPHVDVITFLTWREDENGLMLITAGRDGRIIIWTVSNTNLTYEVHERFLILKQYFTTTAAPDEHLEVLHMDFQPSKSSYFVAACGGGTLFYCSTKTAKPLPSLLQYKNPILLSYKPRKGIITAVSCNADVFAACGTNSEIQIFKYDQKSPILKIFLNYPALGVRWNTSKELISWGDSIVERNTDCSGGTLICQVEGGISAVEYKISSGTNSRKFAIGNQRGEILILTELMNSGMV